MNRDLIARVRDLHKMTSTPASLILGVDDFFRNFDEMINRHPTPGSNSGKYPPFNIRRRGHEYMIELALAGFSREEITVSLDEDTNVLVITGETEAQLYDPPEISDSERLKILSGIKVEDWKVESDRKKALGEIIEGIQGEVSEPLPKAQQEVKDILAPEEEEEGGFAKADKDLEWSFLHRGIAKRKFKQDFKLPRTSTVKSVKMKNGMLEVHVALPLPKNKGAVSIEIE